MERAEHDITQAAGEPLVTPEAELAEQDAAAADAAAAPVAEPALDGEAVPSSDEEGVAAVGEAGIEGGSPAAAGDAPAVAPPPEPDYKDRYLRAHAELDNVRKRARRDVGAAEGRGIARLARELLPALDNLERALAAAEAADGDTEHHLTQGIRIVQSELLGALTKVGIQAESPKGEPFDPHRHEAIAQLPVEGTAPGVVVEVYQAGYVLQDAVLRPARVVVSA